MAEEVSANMLYVPTCPNPKIAILTGSKAIFCLSLCVRVRPCALQYTLSAYIKAYIGMAITTNRLSDLAVRKKKKPGWYPDGAGLYLQIGPNGSKSWVFRYKLGKRERRQGLGRYPDVSPDEAREKATASRKLKASGIDPIDHGRSEEKERLLSDAKSSTFSDCAQRCIDSLRPGWKNTKHAQQWQNTLETYAYPMIGNVPIQDVDTELVVRILEPIWVAKTETATRVRQRIEKVCDWAKGRGLRQGENPARWRGHLDSQLPPPNKVRKVKHLEALPYQEIPAFWQWIQTKNSLSAKALMFTILTATRSGEARGIVDSEFDLDTGVWNIPGGRMKTGEPHSVPLVYVPLQNRGYSPLTCVVLI